MLLAERGPTDRTGGAIAGTAAWGARKGARRRLKWPILKLGALQLK